MGADRYFAVVIHEPDDHISLLLDEAAFSEDHGFEAPAPDLAKDRLLPLAFGYTDRNFVNKAGIAERDVKALPYGQLHRPDRVDAGDEVVHRFFDRRGNAAGRPVLIFRVSFGIADTPLRVIKIGDAVADTLFLNVVLGGFQHALISKINYRLIILKKAEPEQFEQCALGCGFGPDAIICGIGNLIRREYNVGDRNRNEQTADLAFVCKRFAGRERELLCSLFRLCRSADKRERRQEC